MTRILGHGLLILGMILLLGGLAQASGIRINFLAEAEVAGERILVGDLAASVSGDDQAAVERIKETVVGPSPAPGRSVRITSRRINDLLSFGNLGQDKLQARIPPQINVRRGSTEVTRQMMEQAFQEAVEDSLPFVPDQVEIVDVRTPKDLTLPPGELEIVTQLKGRLQDSGPGHGQPRFSDQRRPGRIQEGYRAGQVFPGNGCGGPAHCPGQDHRQGRPEPDPPPDAGR